MRLAAGKPELDQITIGDWLGARGATPRALERFWRPILVSRVASHARSEQTAPVLSIESQAKSLFVAVTAPLLGWSVDWITSYDHDLRFLPIAALGLAISAIMLLSMRSRTVTE